MFSAWNKKSKQHNMLEQKVYSLPSMGRFVGEIAKKKIRSAKKN